MLHDVNSNSNNLGIKYGTMLIEDAFTSHGSERWPRIFLLAVSTNIVKTLLQLDNHTWYVLFI